MASANLSGRPGDSLHRSLVQASPSPEAGRALEEDPTCGHPARFCGYCATRDEGDQVPEIPVEQCQGRDLPPLAPFGRDTAALGAEANTELGSDLCCEGVSDSSAGRLCGDSKPWQEFVLGPQVLVEATHPASVCGYGSCDDDPEAHGAPG